MPFLKETQIDDVSISFWHITECQNEMLALLPNNRHYAEQVATFRSEHRRKEWLAVRCLLHRQLGPEAEIGYLSTGRPVLLNVDLEVSISHSDHLAALAIAPSGMEVGIDIEHNIDRAFRLVHRFLTDEEQEELIVTPSDATLLWCAKEAVYKLCDTEGLSFLDDICLEMERGQLLAKLPTLNEEAVLLTDVVEECAFALARYRT